MCIHTGEPATLTVTVDAPVGGGLGLLWLLLLAGPLGLLALLVLAVTRGGGETVPVKLPYSDPAYARNLGLRRFRDVTLILTFVAVMVAAVGFLDVTMVWVGLAVACLVTCLVAHVRLDWLSVDVTLDGSRRWVHLGRVHPAFVEAVRRTLPADHRLPT